MPTKLYAEIKGLQQTTDNLERMAEGISGAPFVQGMRQATMMVTRDARLLAPVDTGRLKNSIIGEIRVEQAAKMVVGVVGSNVSYAPFQELGTKRGVKAKRFLQGALEKNLEEIKRLLGNTIRGILN